MGSRGLLTGLSDKRSLMWLNRLEWLPTERDGKEKQSLLKRNFKNMGLDGTDYQRRWEWGFKQKPERLV